MFSGSVGMGSWRTHQFLNHGFWNPSIFEPLVPQPINFMNKDICQFFCGHQQEIWAETFSRASHFDKVSIQFGKNCGFFYQWDILQQGIFFSCSLYFNFLVSPSLWQLLSVISVLSHFTIPAVRSQKSLIKVAWLYVLRVKNMHSGHPQTYRFHEMRLAKQSTSHYYARQSQGTYITTSVFNCLPSVGPKQLCAVKTKVRTQLHIGFTSCPRSYKDFCVRLPFV